MKINPFVLMFSAYKIVGQVKEAIADDGKLSVAEIVDILTTGFIPALESFGVQVPADELHNFLGKAFDDYARSKAELAQKSEAFEQISEIV